MRKDLDLRSEIEGEPLWIVFFGRKPSVTNLSVVGHAFVGFGREDSSRRMSWLEAFGLYPQESSVKLVFGRVPGHIREDAWVNSDVLVSCRVNRARFDEALALKERWAQAQYRLMFQDCVTFTFEVAGLLGLKLPARSTLPDTVLLPVAHITQLGEINDTQDFPYGDWSSSDAGRRWRLVLGLQAGTWIERSASGATLPMPTRIERLGARNFKIERDNSDAVLAYLGAREAVRRALLAAGVRPSYMILTRMSVTQFDAKWFGLRWTLDAQNNLSTIVQPGTVSGASYTLARKT